MKITIFGASGRVGTQVLKKALKDGHIVNAFTRNVNKLCLEHEKLNIYEGDVLNTADVVEVLKGSDVVISLLGADDISKPIKMLSEGIKNIIHGMKVNGIKKLVAIAGSGVLDDPSGKLRGEVDHPPFLQYVFADHNRVYNELKNCPVDWTLVCPHFMPEGSETGKIRITENALPDSAKPVTVGDIAALVYKIALQDLYPNTRVGVAV